MEDGAKELRATKGYSMYPSEHAEIAREAAARGLNASQLIRMAIQLYIRVNPAQPSQKAS